MACRHAARRTKALSVLRIGRHADQRERQDMARHALQRARICLGVPLVPCGPGTALARNRARRSRSRVSHRRMEPPYWRGRPGAFSMSTLSVHQAAVFLGVSARLVYSLAARIASVLDLSSTNGKSAPTRRPRREGLRRARWRQLQSVRGDCFHKATVAALTLAVQAYHLHCPAQHRGARAIRWGLQVLALLPQARWRWFAGRKYFRRRSAGRQHPNTRRRGTQAFPQHDQPPAGLCESPCECAPCRTRA